MNDINKWQEAISTLPDKQFFNTMRLYLGEIKTPYNKQRLIEQLASFIRREENANAIITLLDEFDVKVLTAISLIHNPTITTISNFFKTEYTFSELYSEIINLKERLLIYSQIEQYTQKEFLFINPLIQERLLPFLNTNLILPQTQTAFYTLEDSFEITPNFLAAYISFIKIRGMNCRSDGIIKKNDLNRLEAIFPNMANTIQLITTAFTNLSLLKEGEKHFTPELSRIAAFAELSHQEQIALLCAASVSRFSRDGLKKEALLLLDCLASIPQTGYTRQTIIRLAFLVGSFTEDGNAVAKKSRFSQMLEAAHGMSEQAPEQNADLLDQMIDSAIAFGLLQAQGTDENANTVYISSLNKKETENAEVVKGLLNIDSTYTVTLMPGLSLKALLPLTNFLIIKKYGVVTAFEITKYSISSSFDNGWTPDTIFTEIKKYTNYDIPENLCINISEWYNSYSSAILYHGYILKVTDKNITFVENNPNVRKYLKEKLADGIYLLNIPEDFDVTIFTEQTGLEFLGKIREASYAAETFSFPILRTGKNINIIDSSKTYLQTSVAAADKLLKSLQAKLVTDAATANFDKNQQESLLYRISNRLILSEQQLMNVSLRPEIYEAHGMDFSGKVHLIEAAIKDEDFVEIQLPSADGNGTFFTIVGTPLGLSKQPGEAIVRIQVEPDHEIQNIIVSHITLLRRLRY